MTKRYPDSLGTCPCSRTREYCVTRGCKKDDFEWRYSTEGREKDRLRRVVDLRATQHVEVPAPFHASLANNPPRFERRPRPVTRWLRPERAVAEAWRMNMKAEPGVSVVIKLGSFDIRTPGVP